MKQVRQFLRSGALQAGEVPLPSILPYESPFVDLVERLSGKGREVRIFDASVNLASLVGTNRDYLMGALPHVAEMIVPKISDATDWADTVVVTSANPVYSAEIAKLSPDKVVLDFAEFHLPARSLHVRMKRIPASIFGPLRQNPFVPRQAGLSAR